MISHSAIASLKRILAIAALLWGVFFFVIAMASGHKIIAGIIASIMAIAILRD